MGVECRIFNELSRNTAINMLMDVDLSTPQVMTLKPYKRNRSADQNALSHVWYAGLAAKLHEFDAGGYKGFCKLHFGIPILREDPEFSEMYDRIFKPMPYGMKHEIMSTPGLFDVTSLMNTEQMSLYLEQIQRHFADRIQLRFPDEPQGY